MERAEKDPSFIIIGQAGKLSRPGQAQSRSRNGGQISVAGVRRAACYGRGSSATPTRKGAASLGDR